MKKILALLLIATPVLAFSVDHGNGVGNGGDICENRFKTVRDDLNAWILKGGSAGLTLPEGVSFGQYNQSMLQKIQEAKISCTDDALFVGHAEKTCKNFVADDGAVLINCNTDRFMKTSDSDQYVLVHHEYAGLARFEVNNGESSDYTISNQIAAFLEDVLVKKLVVKPSNPTSSSNPNCTIQAMQPLIEAGIKNYILRVMSSNHIEIEASSVQILYKGLRDFEDLTDEDYGFVKKKEYSFDVTFKTAKGSEFKIITPSPDWPLSLPQPSYPALYVPQAFIEKIYDSEGNSKGEQCVVNSHRGYERHANFINTSSNKIIVDDYISSTYGEFASKDLSK